MTERLPRARRQITVWADTIDVLRELSFSTDKTQVELLDEAVKDLVRKYKQVREWE